MRPKTIATLVLTTAASLTATAAPFADCQPVHGNNNEGKKIIKGHQCTHNGEISLARHVFLVDDRPGLYLTNAFRLKNNAIVIPRTEVGLGLIATATPHGMIDFSTWSLSGFNSQNSNLILPIEFKP